MEETKTSYQYVETSKTSLLSNAEPAEILKTVIRKETPVIMTYLSRGKWHAVKVQLANLGPARVDAIVSPRKNPHPLNINSQQTVGFSLKYNFGKCVFQTKVIGLELSGGTQKTPLIVIQPPARIDVIPRRSYFRVTVPPSLKVTASVWQRKYDDTAYQPPQGNTLQGTLVDISAGGAQVAFDTSLRKNFKPGMSAALAFTPMPGQNPLILNTQIRTVLPTADEKYICLGMQIVGLEASPQGHQTLFALVAIVEQYYKINLLHGNTGTTYTRKTN